MKEPGSYWKNTWKQFRKNKPGLFSFYLLLFFVLLSLSSDFIANKQPYYAKYRGKIFYPVFQTLFNKNITDSTINPATKKYERLQFDITDWRELQLDKVIWAPIPYSASQKDKYNMQYASPASTQYYKNAEGKIVNLPFVLKHHLGTNNIGEDLASGLIHGTSIALKVGLISMSIAAFFGILLGAMAGYFGDNKLIINRGSLLLAIPGIFFGYFYGFIVRFDDLKYAFNTSLSSSLLQLIISLILFTFITLLLTFAGRLLNKIHFFRRNIYLPIDIFISRLIEIFDSIPALLLIITISSLFVEKSLPLVMIIIGCLVAPHIARLTRAEFLRIRNLEYVQSARALGYRDVRIILKHILPNALSPLLVYIAFGVANAILAESSLSFLGIGVPADTVTWGSLLSSARLDYTAWWMALYPGLAIFITVAMYNLIGEGIRDALNPKMNT